MKQDRKDRGILIFINLAVQIMFVFYTTFFNIFIYSINNDIVFVLLLNAFLFLVDLLFQLFLTKILTKKNAMIIYRLSFVMIFLSILLAFFVTATTIWLAWVIMAFYGVAKMCYYVPHEIAVMNKGKNVSMKNFVGLSSIVSSLSAILSPFLSGFIIGQWSYFAIFGVILALASIAFVFSIFLKDFYVEPKTNLSLKTVFVEAHKNKKSKYALFAFGLEKFSQASVIPVLLPLLLFLKTGGEMSVGLYSSLVALFATLSLAVYVGFVKNKPVAMIIASTLNISASIMLILWTNFVSFIIYYIVRESCHKIFHNGMTSTIFTANKNTVFEENKREWHMVFSTYNQTCSILAALITILLYTLWPTEITLTIIILVLSLTQIASVYFLNKSDGIIMTQTAETVSVDEESQCQRVL